MYDDMMTHEQIQRMFSKESDDVEFLGFESILLILVLLLLVVKTGASLRECDLYTSINGSTVKISMYCNIFKV